MNGRSQDNWASFMVQLTSLVILCFAALAMMAL